MTGLGGARGEVRWTLGPYELLAPDGLYYLRDGEVMSWMPWRQDVAEYMGIDIEWLGREVVASERPELWRAAASLLLVCIDAQPVTLEHVAVAQRLYQALREVER